METRMKTTKGRPKKVEFELKTEVLAKFINRVYQGQSINMLCWEFKLTQYQVRQICKQNSLVVNSGDYITFSNKLHGKGVVR